MSTETFQLRHRLNPGERLVLGAETRQETWIGVPGKVAEVVTYQEDVTTVDVVAVDEAGVIEVRVGGSVWKATTDRSVDLRKDATQDRPPTTFHITPTGQVVRCHIEPFHGPWQEQEPQLEDMIAYVVRQFPPLARLPDEPVTVGATWSGQSALAGPYGSDVGAAAEGQLFAVTEVGGQRCAWLRGELEVPLRFALPHGPAQMAFAGTFRSQTHTLFALAAGRATRGQATASVTATVAVTLPAQPPQTMPLVSRVVSAWRLQ